MTTDSSSNEEAVGTTDDEGVAFSEEDLSNLRDQGVAAYSLYCAKYSIDEDESDREEMLDEWIKLVTEFSPHQLLFLMRLMEATLVMAELSLEAAAAGDEADALLAGADLPQA